MESEFDPSELTPQTEPADALEPPRRRPPTAVGTGKLPPRRPPRDEAGDGDAMPEDDGTPYPVGPTRLRRIALRLLATYVAAGTLTLLWPLGWRAYAGAVMVLLANTLWRRAAASKAAEHVTGAAQPDDAASPPNARSA
jgi:hypothetical protein